MINASRGDDPTIGVDGARGGCGGFPNANNLPAWHLNVSGE
jgi:hypothetical protein